VTQPRTVAAAAILAYGNVALPLFPAFITFTAVTIPGVSLLPRTVAVALLIIDAVLAAVYGIRFILARQTAPMLPALLGWLGAGVLAAILGFSPVAGAVFIGIYVMGIVWHLAIMRYYTRTIVARFFVWSLLVTCCLACLAALAMVMTKWPAAQYTIGHGRAIGTFVLPGELAGYLVILLPISYGVSVTTCDVRLRMLARISLATGVVTMVLTFSRAGWVGLAAAAAFFVLACSGMLRVRIAIAGGIVLAVLGAIALLFDAAHNPSENFTRPPIWSAALQIIDRFPLTGVGPFDFSRLYSIVRSPDADVTAFHAHSFYLSILCETGIVGIAATCWVWYRFVAELYKRLCAATPQAFVLATAVLAGLVGTLVQGFIDTVSVVIFGLWLPMMAFALAAAQDGLVEAAA
jgi:putative inorganic carbon (HCO3(-)) transporter